MKKPRKTSNLNNKIKSRLQIARIQTAAISLAYRSNKTNPDLEEILRQFRPALFVEKSKKVFDSELKKRGLLNVYENMKSPSCPYCEGIAEYWSKVDVRILKTFSEESI